MVLRDEILETYINGTGKKACCKENARIYQNLNVLFSKWAGTILHLPASHSTSDYCVARRRIVPCGEGGIRTRGPLQVGGLVNLCTRPLCDLSKEVYYTKCCLLNCIQQAVQHAPYVSAAPSMTWEVF